MSGLKTYGAIAVMLGCFAIVYPRFMHPIVANIFGFGSAGDAARRTQDSHTTYPPGSNRPHPSERGAGGAHPEDVRRHMRHGPHPGMRAAAEMQRQQNQQGSGRGMMGVVLPMYAVGIVLYLGYTLYKVFNKNNSKTNGSGGRYSWDKTGRYSKDRDRMGFPKDCDGRNDEIRNFLHDQEHRQNLEDLLTRVDDKNVSVEEMKVLQKRLEETEAQMTRILQAMRGINDNVDTMAAGEQPQTDGDINQDNVENDHKTKNDNGDSPSQKEAVESDDNITENEKPGKENTSNEEQEGTEGDNKGLDANDSNDEHEESEENNADSNDDDDDDQEIVDEVIDDNKDDSDDKDDTSAVRQRNVKSNEQ